MSIQVLHVLESWRPEAGAVAISVYGLIPALDSKAVSSSVFASVVPEGMVGDVHVEHDSGALAGSVAKASVVHIHGWGAAWAPAAATAARKAAKPYVITPLGRLCDGPYAQQRGWKHRLFGILYENKIIRGTTQALALNKLECEALLDERVPLEAQVLAYGLSAYDYSDGKSPGPAPESENADDRIILILGPIHPVEGLVPFLRAFAEIGADNDGWKIVIAGPDEDENQEVLAAAVRRKGASDRVRFQSCSSLESQKRLLRQASVLACPSLHYRAPVSIMQAMASGVPVIASDRVAPDGASEVADVCRPSRDEFRETLRVALGRPDEERAAMAARARDWFRERFDWGVLVDRYVRLYRDLV